LVALVAMCRFLVNKLWHGQAHGFAVFVQCIAQCLETSDNSSRGKLLVVMIHLNFLPGGNRERFLSLSINST